MATILLPIAGGVIGGIVGGPAGASLGMGIGSLVGSTIELLNTPSVEVGRLADNERTISLNGAPIPVIKGRIRRGGNVVWKTDLQEHTNEQGGGKGRPRTVQYTYTVSCAVLLCEGTIQGVNRIWAGDTIIYDSSQSPATRETIRVYTGTSGQSVDSLISADNTAHSKPTTSLRGMAYVVFENFDLTPYGNTLPDLSFEIQEASTTTLGACVGALLDRCGLNGLYDVSAGTDSFTGFYFGGEATVLESLIPLLQAFSADLVEVDGIVKLIKRGGSVVATVSASELGSTTSGKSLSPYEVHRISELELPQQLSITYLDPAADFSPLTQTAYRFTKGDYLQHTANITVSVAMSADVARQAAERRLYALWREADSVIVSLPPKYRYTAPGDVLQVPLDSTTHRLRIEKQTFNPFGEVECECVFDDTDYLTQSATGGPSATRSSPSKLAPSPTTFEVFSGLDIENIDKYIPNFYVVANGDSNWTGGAVYYSPDNSEWIYAGWLSTRNAIGASVGTLATWAGAAGWDTTNSVDVLLTYGTLTPDSQLGVTNGTNRAILGNEGIGFSGASLVSANRYTLSTLLRRQYDTSGSGHANGDRFATLLNPFRVQVDTSLIGTTVYVKVVSAYQTLADVSAKTLTISTPETVPYTNTDGTEVADRIPIFATGKQFTSDAYLKYTGGKLTAGNLAVNGILLINSSGQYDVAAYFTMPTARVLKLGDGTLAPRMEIDGAAANTRELRFNTNGSRRFVWRLNATAESGSSAGSDFELIVYSDAGNATTALQIMRASSEIRLPVTGSGAGILFGGDAKIYRGAADRLDLASGDTLNIVLGSLLFAGTTVIDSSRNISGVAGTFTAQLALSGTGSANGVLIGADAQLYRGAADRLDIATGDSLNLVNGSLLAGGTVVLDSSRVLQNVTANVSILTSGTLVIARGGTGLSSLGTASQLLGVNTGATALEYKTASADAASDLTMTLGAGTLVIGRTLSTATPLANDGSAQVGTSKYSSREDHKHPVTGTTVNNRIFALDNFGIGSVLISGHSDDYANTYTLNSYAFQVDWTQITYIGGHNNLSHTDTVSATVNVAYNTATPPNANYKVYAQIWQDWSNGTGSRNQLAICGRMATNALTCYILKVTPQGSSTWTASVEVGKYVAGAYTTLMGPVNYSGTFLECMLEMNGTTINGWVNGVALDGAHPTGITDSAISATGKAGIISWGDATSVSGTTAKPKLRMSQFKAGAITETYYPGGGAITLDMDPSLNKGAVTGGTNSNAANFLTGSKTWNIGTLNNGANITTTTTVTGAVDGNPVLLGVPNANRIAGVVWEAWVSAADTVTIRAINNSGSNQSLGNLTYKVAVHSF